MKYFYSPVFILCIAVSLLWFDHSAAKQEEDADIKDIIITTSPDHVLLFATVKHGIKEEMIEGVRNGIPITFTFHIELEQVKNNWPDSTLTKFNVSHTLTYDTLKEEYSVELSERVHQKITTDSVAKAKEIMSELSGIKVIELKKLIPETSYLLHIKATLAEKKLPLNIHSFIPFISLWNFETDRRTIEFRY